MASLSVIMPVHRDGKAFRRSLAAVYRSTERLEEVIVASVSNFRRINMIYLPFY